MNMETNPIRLKAEATYNAAADHFDDEPLGFWNRHELRAAELAALRPADFVLDVGCGTGSSALPAAKLVGPKGRVLGIDLAANMLERAREKVAADRLDNVEFRRADMMAIGEPDGQFDAVICVFSIFFVPDMERQITELWRMLRPGGRLVVTVWTETAFTPAMPIFREEFRRIRPDIPQPTRPWERLTFPASLSRMLTDGGATEPEIHHVPDHQALRDPSDWWTIALGSGFRWEIEQLGSYDQFRVRDRTLSRLADRGITEIEISALHAVATKLE